MQYSPLFMIVVYRLAFTFVGTSAIKLTGTGGDSSQLKEISNRLIGSNPGLFIAADEISPDVKLANEDRVVRDSEIPRQTGTSAEDLNYLDRLWNWIRGVTGTDKFSALPYPHYSSTYLNQYVYQRTYDPSDSILTNVAGDVLIDPTWNPDRPPRWDIWHDGTRIPFIFSEVDDCTEMIVQEAMIRFTEATNGCIKFEEAKNANLTDILHISSSEKGCFASLGFTNSTNLLNVGTGCKNVGTVMHLLGHVLGLAHEDQRADARKYVQLKIDNIDVFGMSASSEVDPVTSAKFPFVFALLNETRTAWESKILDLPYEYGSLMHNSRNIYAVDISVDRTLSSSNGSQFDDLMGNRAVLTERDARLLNEMYSCQRLPVPVANRFFKRPLYPGLTYDQINECLLQDVMDETKMDVAK
jgi:hypothetical protein